MTLRHFCAILLNECRSAIAKAGKLAGVCERLQPSINSATEHKKASNANGDLILSTEKMRVALRPYLQKILSDIPTDRVVTEELFNEYCDCVMSWLSNRIGVMPEIGQRVLCFYLVGMSAEDAISRVEMPLEEMKRYIKVKRDEFRNICIELGRKLLVGNVQVREYLEPIVRRLGRKAFADVHELTPKESVKAFLEMGRLLGQMTGELVERKEVQISAVESYGKLLSFRPEDSEEFKAIVIEPVVERKLIE